jgi:hypothetical protein
MPGVDRQCVTHHDACDCREAARREREQALQARVAQLEAALRYYADDRRWPVQPGEDRVPRADPDIAADALAATASPVADVVRASVAVDDTHNMSNTAELARLSIAVAALLEQQPGVWE